MEKPTCKVRVNLYLLIVPILFAFIFGTIFILKDADGYAEARARVAARLWPAGQEPASVSTKKILERLEELGIDVRSSKGEK